MKKLLFLFTCAAVIGSIAAAPAPSAAQTAAEVLAGQPEIAAVEAYSIEANTGSVLYEKNATERRPIASMAKIMTLELTFEAIDEGNLSMDEAVSVSPNAAGMGGSQAFLDAGGSYPVRTLIQSVVVASANDSCVALAERIAGSVEGFVARMNAKAAALGMADTNFVNCTGLPAANHYSCAKDVAAMSRALFSRAPYYDFSGVWMYDLEHPSGRITGLTNTNRLIRTLSGCDGGKTGYTSEAGSCISATAKRDGMRLITVVMGEPDSKTRNADVTKVMNYGFANYGVTRAASCGDIAGAVEVTGGREKTVNAVVSRDLDVFSSKTDKGEITTKAELNPTVSAPLAKGSVVGTFYVMRGGVVVAQCELTAASDVAKKTFGDAFKDVISRF